MKRMKKILSILLSVVMVMAMGITAFAGDSDASGEGQTPTTYTVTITNATGTYEIYQVFTGDLDAATKTLSNVKWGKNVNAFTYTTKDATDIEAAESSNKASEIAEYLATKTDDSAVAKDFAKTAIKNVNGSNSGEAIATNETAKFENLTAGYYVVKNTSVKDEESYTEYILQVVGNVSVENKADVPQFEKKVKDTNDTTGAITDWQDSADYDIGDVIPFRLKGTIADNYDEYSTYYYAFHDQEETGLTFKEITSVYVVNNGVTTELTDKQYKVKTTECSDGCSFEVVFSNLKALKDENGAKIVNANSEIYVEYTSTLNDQAVLGSQGNLNKAKLEFSNNPNGAGHGETPWDNVIVFTYKVVIDKKDDSKQPLTGAEFTLTKKVAKKDSDGNVVNGQDGKPEYDAKTVVVVKSDEGTKFTFKGLDDGDYILTETVTPAGFNTIDPITFTVTATHDIEWTTQDRTDVLTDLKGDKVTGEITFTSDKTEGSLTATVINKKGSVLPSTGGIGTTIFYVVGAILMIGAGVILVSRRRVNK